MARIAAVLMFGFFMMFAIGEGFPPLWRQPLSVQLDFAALGLIFLGYAIGWRYPALGGSISLLGYVVLNLVQLSVSHKLAGGAFPLFAIPGLLYLAAWYVSTRQRTLKRANSTSRASAGDSINRPADIR
jgi:hypothetical protein